MQIKNELLRPEHPLSPKEEALIRVEAGKSTIEWFHPDGQVINEDECTFENLSGHPKVLAIIDHTLQTCVGYKRKEQ